MTLRIKMLVLQVIGKLDIFPLMCALIKSGSLNWPWSTKILGHFVTHMPKNYIKEICYPSSNQWGFDCVYQRVSEWLLFKMPNEQFSSYIKARTSYIWWDDVFVVD
jgi:hypothetical protein